MALYDTNKNLIAGSRKTNIYRCDSFAEYEALPAAEKAKYDYVATPDEKYYQTGTVEIITTSGQTVYEVISLPISMPDLDYCIDVQVISGFPEHCILSAMHTSTDGFRIYAYNTGIANYTQTVKWQVYRIPH